jgi:hypothetical protein
MTAERILRVGTVGRITTLDPLYATDPANATQSPSCSEA